MNSARLSPSLTNWARGLPATGIFEELAPGRYRLTVSQSALAEKLGYRPGSGALSRRLQRLEDAGVLLSRRPFVIDLGRLDPTREEPLPRSGPQPPPALAGPPATTLAGEGLLLQLLERAIDHQMEVLALRLLEEILPIARNRAASPAVPRGVGEESARFAPSTRSFESSVHRQGSSTLASHARNARTQPGVPRTAADMRNVLGPLLDECALRGIPGITNMPGLLSAAAGSSDQEIVDTAEQILIQLRNGASIHSPVGLLSTALAERRRE